MAQVVGFFDNNVEYKEGPFVVCLSAMGSYPRVEAEKKGSHCPVIPDLSVLEYADGLRKQPEFKSCEARVDHLNQLVREGKIVLRGDVWVLAP